MNPIEFEGQTNLMGPPDSMEKGSCGALPVQRFVNGASSMGGYVSVWKPTPEEVAALQRGGYVRLAVYGNFHQPVWLDVLDKPHVKELP